MTRFQALSLPDVAWSWLPDLAVVDCKNGYQEKGQESNEVQTNLGQESHVDSTSGEETCSDETDSKEEG